MSTQIQQGSDQRQATTTEGSNIFFPKPVYDIDAALEEALKDTFPASDPLSSPRVTSNSSGRGQSNSSTREAGHGDC